METNELAYHGRPAAWIDNDGIELAPWLEGLDRSEPLRRFVEVAASFLHDAERKSLELAAPVQAAVFYARSVLMPFDEWLPRQGWSDDALAEHFNVPLAEAKWRRLDVAMVNLIEVGELPG